MSALLEARNITKDFVNHRALNGVSIAVPRGSIFGLLGPNGAGKTTLIRIINQITAADSGEIVFSGKKLNADHIRNIGYLPEERGLYKKMKIGEQALYLTQLKGLSKSDANQKLNYWFEKFDILPWWNRKVDELSKGMQQKLQFIVTIAHEPELLIFDEPFSGFDPINVNLLKDEILNLRHKGATIIFSTHNMASVEELCDNIALINRSETILSGKVKEIKESFKNDLYEVEFIAENEDIENILPAEYKAIEVDKTDNIAKAQIRLTIGSDPNELLKLLVNKIKIRGFREILPGMNEIFIRKVKENEIQVKN